MDFTPGAMHNAGKDQFRPIFEQPMSQGTRCHQLAMYVVYESPLQMLCDSPTNYEREPEAMEFLSAVPTTWDDTRVLAASIGHYVIVARKMAGVWYIGAMGDWAPRDLAIDLAFTGLSSADITVYADGVNADRFGSDFTRTRTTTEIKEPVKIHLASGGGWVAVVRPPDNR